MNFRYPKTEKLKSRKTIELLFTEGKSLSVFPLKLFYLPLPEDEKEPLKMAVSVSKRNFKSAVKRNRIKRLLRECYRLNKHIFVEKTAKKYACLILYTGKEEPDFHQLQKTTKRLFEKFNEEKNS